MRAIVTADDYGLSRSATSSILEAADTGRLDRVSILPNGHALEYAIEEWQKRKDRLSLAVHLNLTEGKPLSKAEDIPHLVRADGTFCHSPQGLLVKAIFSSRKDRAALRREIKHELNSQVNHVRSLARLTSLHVDGHQHVHMIPIVFDALLDLHSRCPFASIRIPREPFFFPPMGTFTSGFIKPLLRHFTLNVLARRNMTRAREVRVSYPEYFVGTFQSGQLSLLGLTRALSAVPVTSIVEIATHPGVPQETFEWSGDVAWHASPLRGKENQLVKDAEFVAVVSRFERGDLSRQHFARLVRFVITGCVALFTQLLVLYILTEYARLWYLISATVGWACAFGVSFLLQRFWTFQQTTVSHLGNQMALYFLLQFMNAVLNAITMLVLVEYARIPYVPAQLFIAVAIAIWTYILSAQVIFSPSKRS